MGSRLGCLYHPIFPGFYSGGELVLKTNRTLRKKLVEPMTAFLVAKPSVLLQQLAEGSAVALDLHVCVFAWVAGTGWRGRRECWSGGESVCMLGNSITFSKFAWEGRRKVGCGSVCKHMWQRPSLGGCGWGAVVFCVHVSRITRTEWGLRQDKGPQLHSYRTVCGRAGRCIANPPAVEDKDVHVHQGGIVK